MDQATVTALTAAFDVSGLVDTFLLFAPYLIGVAGVLIGIALIKWGFKKIRAKLSGGIA